MFGIVRQGTYSRKRFLKMVLNPISAGLFDTL